MINAPQSVIDALKSGQFQYANIVDVNLGDAYATGTDLVLHITDFGRTVWFDGIAYNHDNALVEMDGITRKASTGSDKVDLMFTVADETLVEAIVSRRYINKPTVIRRVIIDQSNNIVGNFAIPIRTSWGLAHSIDGDLEERTVTLRIDSQLGDLNEDNGWYTVSASHNQRYPDDEIMKYSYTVMDEEDQKRYSTNFNGVINQENKPPALRVVYGYKNAELVPLWRLTHRKTHSTYRHYFTLWCYVINIGDVEEIDLKSMTRDGEPFKPTIVNHQGWDVGGWSCRVRHLRDQDKPIRGNPDFNFFFEGMNGSEPSRFDGMYGKGLTLLLVKNRNRDDWVKTTPKIKIPIRGTKVLDPRTGLSSASRNPALQYYDYLRSPTYGAGGRGITVDQESIIKLANHFDALPDSAGNDGINSILIDVEIDTAQPIVDNMNTWIEGVRMYTSDYYGVFTVRAESISPIVASYHEDDLLDFPDYESGDFTDRLNQLTYTVNQLVPSEEDPQVKVEVTVEATFPEDGSAIHQEWLAEDAGIHNFESKSLSYVTDLQQAYYWAMVDSRISRKPDELTIAVGSEGWLHEVGDVISFTSPILEMTDSTWRIIEVSEDDGKVELELKPYDPTFYTPEPNAIPTPIPPAQPPVIDRLEAVRGLNVQVAGDKYEVSWEQLEAPSGYWFHLEVLLNDEPVIVEPTIYNTPYLFDAELEGTYTVNVTKINLTDESATASVTFSAARPEVPTVNVIRGVNFLTLEPSLTGTSFGTRFRFYIANLAVAEGYSFTHTALLPNTEYTYQVSTINALGESPKATVTASTLVSDEVFAEQPTVPTNVKITPVTSALNAEWDKAQYLGHSHANIYYQPVGDNAGVPLLLPEFSKAKLTTSTPANLVTVPTGGQLSGYVFVTNVNLNGIESASSDPIFAIPKKFIDPEQFDEALDLLDKVNKDLDLKISTEVLSRKDSDKAIFDTAAAAVQLKKDLTNGMAGLTDAVFEFNPTTGLIGLKAYSYTDNAFNQAGLLIDGVKAEVLIQAGKLTTTENRIANAESQIAVQAGQISLKASYTEVNTIVANAIDAVVPAYSFGFFNSTEGWSAVTGTITQGVNELLLTKGDVRNSALNYQAKDNPIISFVVDRTAGSGWIGDLEITFSGGSNKVYAGVIQSVPTGKTTRVLNLGGESTYTGTVTGVRLILGSTTADTFKLSNVTIGKPSASLEAIDGLTAQVNNLGIEIDAVEGSLANYVTTAFYEANTVTLNNLEVKLNGTDSIISLKATQQQINENNVITKANSAAQWIDASSANITQVVQSYNAQPNGIDDQLDDLSDNLNLVQTEVDASLGLIRDQALSINNLGNKDNDLEKNAFYAQVALLKQRDNLLEVGESLALADRKIQATTTDVSALSQEFLNLEASVGSDLGQINGKLTSLSQVDANLDRALVTYANKLQSDIDGNYKAQSALIQQVESTANGTATALAGLTTQVEGIDGELNTAQLQLESTINELGEVASRASLGVTSTANGVTTVNGVLIDGATNTIAFQTGAMEWIDLSGNKQLYWDSASGKLKFTGIIEASEMRSTKIIGAEISGPKITGADITGGKIKLIGSDFMMIQDDSGFGSEGLWYWFGAKRLINGNPDLSYATKANAKEWKDIHGNAYFGGAILSGELINKLGNSAATYPTLPYTAITTPAWSSFGRPKQVLLEWDLRYTQQVMGETGTDRQVSGYIEIKIESRFNGGAWAQIDSITFNMVMNVTYTNENPVDRWAFYSIYGTGTLRINEPAGQSGNYEYRVSVVRYYPCGVAVINQNKFRQSIVLTVKE